MALFKRYRNNKQVKPEKPKIKQIKIKEKHENTRLDKICYLLNSTNTHRLGLREILGLSKDETEKYAYILVTKILNLVLIKKKNLSLINDCLKKILKCENRNISKKVLFEYFYCFAMVGIFENEIAELLVEYFYDDVVIQKNNILNVLPKGRLWSRIKSMVPRVRIFDWDQPIFIKSSGNGIIVE
ncbi:hypothetical protein TCON_0597 [Astathelohania contejeani]|uniref:Uncharacterized protein n=1 Tax=Astathelohania contejeani TaxID=164912 RepID=A0ABQ7I1C1_9MICR|nr:hypothetical protein TCON_0597 [Thelohania contejeani]